MHIGVAGLRLSCGAIDLENDGTRGGGDPIDLKDVLAGGQGLWETLRQDLAPVYG